MAQDKLAVVVLISGSGSNLQAIIDLTQKPDCPYQVKAVISNKDGVKGLERAQKSGIETRVVPHENHESREDYDRVLIQAIDEFTPGLVVLAGFMRILTSAFVLHYSGRLLNIHPSLLPKFRGLNTHAKALEANETEHGASVHFVTEELDGGPVILQAKVPVLENDDADSLAKRVLEQEHRIYPLAVSWFAKGRLKMQQHHAILDDKKLEKPLLLSEIS